MERSISDQTADEAGFWDSRLRAPDCTDTDRADFAAWRDAHPEHRLAFEKIQAIVTTLRNEVGRADIRGLRDAALAAVGRRRRVRTWATAAASIATLAVAALIWTTLPEHTRLAPFHELAAITDAVLGRGRAGIYETGVGQRSTVTLRDGSTVELNSKTRIRVAFSESARHVELIDGQALFHVARNPQRPFIVRAANQDITAIGTAFDVRLDDSSIRVTLLEGKVKVSSDSSKLSSSADSADVASRTSLLAQAGTKSSSASGNSPQTPEISASSTADSQRPAKPGDASGSNEIFLIPGQQFIAQLGSLEAGSHDGKHGRTDLSAGPRIADAQASLVVRSVDVAKVIGWREGKVLLEDLTLADAVAEMNRHSPVEIRIDDPRLAALRLNGMFRAGEQDGFVAALEQYFPITARHDSDTQITLIHKH